MKPFSVHIGYTATGADRFRYFDARKGAEEFCSEVYKQTGAVLGVTLTNADRSYRLAPRGVPRYVRCYDNGGRSADRYTVVFTGRRGGGVYLTMNSEPFHPQGIGQHGATARSWERIDRPTSGHLGKRIKFEELPRDCQVAVLNDYVDIWEIREAFKARFPRGLDRSVVGDYTVA